MHVEHVDENGLGSLGSKAIKPPFFRMSLLIRPPVVKLGQFMTCTSYSRVMRLAKYI